MFEITTQIFTMRAFVFTIYYLLFTTCCFSQQALPLKSFITLRDSTTSMDVVMMIGKGGSLSLDGRNVKLFNGFFEPKTTSKKAVAQAGMIMWQINGREFISGNYYLNDSSGYIVFNKDGKEYVNRMTKDGAGFFKSQIKQ